MRIKSLIVLAVACCIFLVPRASVFASCRSVLDACLAAPGCKDSGSSDTLTIVAEADCRAACATTFDGCHDTVAPPPPASPSQNQSSSGGTASTSKVVSVINPLGITDPTVIIGNLIRAILSIVGSLTLLMFIYGGVLWITSMGNDKTVHKAKSVLTWTVIGLAVIAGAYTLTNAVITSLTSGSALGI